MDLDMDYDSDSMSMGSAPPSPTFTDTPSDDASMRSGSPVSMYSMSSSLIQAAYREEYGRVLNNHSDVYNFPVDDQEYRRQDSQHLTLVELMGGKYRQPMEEVLKPDYPGDLKRCLDLGFGTGKWMVNAAKDFPHADFVGVDLVPIELDEEVPPNCRAEVDDINLGLQHFYGEFDVVRSHLIATGIRDYGDLLDEVSHVLRPGGLLDLAETDLYVYNENFRRHDFTKTELRPPWWARFLTLVREATGAMGGTPCAGQDLYDWVKRHPAFEDVRYREYWIPGSAWREHFGLVPKGQDKQALNSGLAYIDSSRPVLLRRGHPEALVDTFVARSKEELIAAKIPCYARLYTVQARRKGLNREEEEEEEED